MQSQFRSRRARRPREGAVAVGRPSTAAGTAAAFAVAAALSLGLAGCGSPQPAPTGIQSPTPSATADSSEWGAYGGKDDACSAVAGDVLTLALVPKNLALADADGGVADIVGAIDAAADAAPPAIASNYQQLSAIVASYGRELSAWSAAVEAASTATATPSAAPSASAAMPYPSASATAPGGSPSGTPAAAPERPVFVDARFTAQLDTVKGWLTDTCG